MFGQLFADTFTFSTFSSEEEGFTRRHEVKDNAQGVRSLTSE